MARAELCAEGLWSFDKADDKARIGTKRFSGPARWGVMTRIAILIETPQGLRFLVAGTAREAALKAESVIVAVAQAELPVPVWVAGASPDMAGRLMNYLADVQMERVLEKAF